MNEYRYEKIKHEKKIPAMIAVLNYQDIKNYFASQVFIPPHWHRSIEMSYIENASVSLKIGEKEYIVENDFTFVNSGEVHSLSALSVNQHSQAMIVIISYDFIKQYCPEIDHIFFDLTLCQNHEPLKMIYHKMKQLYLHQTQYSYLQITACLLEILNFLLMYCQKEHYKQSIHSKRKREIIKDILSYIHQHYQEELTLAHVAGHFCMSQEYFSRQFHHYIGQSFKDYVSSYRLYKSYEDVVHSDKTIQDISQKHGFFNVKSFIKIFKDVYHETPLQYRKKMSRN